MQNKLGGPRTEQGKARVSQNAVKHGMTSRKMFVLQNENPEEWEQMLADCIQEFQPATPFENRLVEEIAFANWRLRRAWTHENALFDTEMENGAEAFAAQIRPTPTRVSARAPPSVPSRTAARPFRSRSAMKRGSNGLTSEPSKPSKICVHHAHVATNLSFCSGENMYLFMPLASVFSPFIRLDER